MIQDMDSKVMNEILALLRELVTNIALHDCKAPGNIHLPCEQMISLRRCLRSMRSQTAALSRQAVRKEPVLPLSHHPRLERMIRH